MPMPAQWGIPVHVMDFVETSDKCVDFEKSYSCNPSIL